MKMLALVVLLVSTALLAVGADKPAISDDEIHDRVRLRLNNDTDVKGGSIEIKVTQGVVELTGTVRQEKARLKAEKLARKVRGVRSVVNNLKVSATGPL
jgi:osmotically-inducible protein OsmY